MVSEHYSYFVDDCHGIALLVVVILSPLLLLIKRLSSWLCFTCDLPHISLFNLFTLIQSPRDHFAARYFCLLDALAAGLLLYQSFMTALLS